MWSYIANEQLGPIYNKIAVEMRLIKVTSNYEIEIQLNAVIRCHYLLHFVAASSSVEDKYRSLSYWSTTDESSK